MAHFNGREPTQFSEKKEGNKRAHDEGSPLELVPDNYRKPWPKQDKTNYFKNKALRKRKGKAAKPIPNKSIRETVAKESVNGVEEQIFINSKVREVGSNLMMESKHDICNGVEAVNLEASTTDFKSARETPVKPTDGAVGRLEGVRPKVDGEYVCSEKSKPSQEHIVSEMSNCNLHDPVALFNELPYEDKLMLLSNYIEVMKKRSEKYPSAIFNCTLCKFHCMSITICRMHAKGRNHLIDLKERKLNDSMRLVPPPTENHIKGLDKMMDETIEIYGMVESEREVCLKVATELASYVDKNFPGCSLTLYGSVASRLALKESNIDLNLQTPPKLNGPTTLGALAESISKTPLFSDVVEDFDEGRPSIHFVHCRTNIKCSICLAKDETLKTTEIIASYQKVDPRVRQLAIVFRKWAKLCKIDNYKNGMWPPNAFPLLLIYYLQQCEPPVLPVLHEMAGDPEDDKYLDPAELEGKWKQTNNMSLGELWLGLLRFYAVEYQHAERVVCIRKRAPLKRSVKNWIGKRTAIEDPFWVKRNVSRTIIHHYSFRYIMNCFRLSFLYYGIIQTPICALYGHIQPIYGKLEKDPDHLKRNKEISRYWRVKLRTSKYFNFEDVLQSQKGMKNMGNDNDEASIDIDALGYNPEKESDDMYLVAEEISDLDATYFSKRLKKELIKFAFVAENGNKLPPIICTICNMDGHSKVRCPEARLPPLPPLPEMTDEFCAKLDAFCLHIFDEYSQKNFDLKIRKDILLQLEEFLRSYYPDVQLSMFGSSVNGFGFRNSDLDICLTFKSNSSGQGVDIPDLIPKLVVLLRKMPTIRNIVPIPSAKVPIIKFKDIQTQLEGDISLYNTLAQHNTQLLKTYASIDERVQILGYVMKIFAKFCDICDASRGSLSSYAYILMVIYFLQQCKPPVVPVLQEMTDVQPKPVCIQEGQDIWFFKDLDKLTQVWPDYRKNTSSVGSLWLQLLRFYTEDFNFEEHVISIRQKQKVYKFEKLWFKKPMAIEDPFDVNHNLGGALTRKMKLFIIKSLREGRLHYGTPVDELPQHVISWEEYFLNVSRLLAGSPPNNGCHICKKIGHKVRNCPERRNSVKEKKQDVEQNKNAQGFAGLPQDQRRRPQQNFNNNRTYWAKGTALIKDDKRHNIPAFTQQPIRPMWYQPAWYQMQRPGGPHQMVWPHGGMPPNNRTTDMHPPQMSPHCAPHDGNGTKSEMPPRNYVFRSAEQQGQAFHDPRLPLGNYRKQTNFENHPKNHPGEGQSLVSGAIPKVGQVNSQRSRFNKVKGAKSDNRQKP